MHQLLSFSLFAVVLLTVSIFAHHHHNDLKCTDQSSDSFSNATDSLNQLNTTDQCTICEAVYSTIIDSRRSGFTKCTMLKLVKELCTNYSNNGAIFCNSYVNDEIDQMLFIIDNTPNLTPKRWCALASQSSGCEDPDANPWIIPLPPQPETSLKPIEGGSELKILHLTDFHYDFLYKPGSNAKCSEPLCCRNGTPASPEDAAGQWGDYNVCDMPWHSITNLFEHIKDTHESIDYIYFTGDIVSHTWLPTKEENIASIRAVLRLFRESFNKTVFPILGNHEPFPTNLYAPDNVSRSLGTHWVFKVVAEEWSSWLPDTAKETILKGGYYTVLVKPGFRIIALNSNVCFIYNIWLLYNDEDPYGQLKWLVEQLSEAESNNEYVHILSHIPPGTTECQKQWSKQFRAIVNRFANTISAQFNGHTHRDELRVFYNLTNSDQVINVAFNGGSFTTFTGLNPNYRFFSVEPEKYTVSDYDQYTFNITQANKSPNRSPDWYKLYSFKEAWGLDELTLDNLGKLVEDMSANETLVQQYYRFSVRDSDVLMAKGCNSDCLKSTLCSITAVDVNEALNC